MNHVTELCLADLERPIATLLDAPTYELGPEKNKALLALLKLELEYASRKTDALEIMCAIGRSVCAKRERSLISLISL